MSGTRSGKYDFFAASLRCIFAAALLLAGLAPPAFAAQSAAKFAAHEVVSRPHVYLMRGLLNIFSLGMDELAARLKPYGIDASVWNHTFADLVVGEIVQKYRAGDHGPYILVGHSLGADAVMSMAQQLSGQGVPVALVIPVDGTGSYAAPRNVACVVNITQREYAYMRRGAGFHGMLTNVDLSGDPSIDHLTIDKAPRVQAEALRYVLEAAHSQACRPGNPGGAATAAVRPKEAPQSPAPARSASPALRPSLAG